MVQEIELKAAAKDLPSLLDQVCQSHLPVRISRAEAEAVVVMPLTEYNSLLETAYLLQSPANSERLMRSIRNAEAGNIIPVRIEDL